MIPIQEKLPLREKLAYGFGDLASVLYWKTFMSFLPFFYTDVFGLSAAAVGTMFLVSRIFDAIADPVMGMVADRTETRWGKFRPYLLTVCAPYAILGVLTFTVPDFGQTGKLLWAILTYNALMLLYTAINIPYTAMLGVITSNPHERTSLSSIKFIFAYAAGVIVSATLLPMTRYFGDDNLARGWQIAFVIYGVAFVAFFLVAFLGTKERVRPLPEQKSSVKHDLRDLLANRPWVLLLAATLMLVMFVAVHGTAMTHYFKYYVGTQEVTWPFGGGTKTYRFETLVSAFNTVGQATSILGVVLLSWFTRLVSGKKRSFVILFVCSVISTAAYYLLKPNQIGMIFLVQAVGCMTSGPLSALLWSMYGDTADYSEWKTGRRATGLTFSASTMGQKIGWAIGSATALWLMGIVGFKANIDQTPETLHGLVLLVSVIPAFFGLISIGFLFLYPLDDAKVAEISSELKTRRTAEAATVAAP